MKISVCPIVIFSTRFFTVYLADTSPIGDYDFSTYDCKGLLIPILELIASQLCSIAARQFLWQYVSRPVRTHAQTNDKKTHLLTLTTLNH